MSNRLPAQHRWLTTIHSGLDRLLYGLSTYAFPILVALVSVVAFFAWEKYFPEADPAPIRFQILAAGKEDLTPETALRQLRDKPSVQYFDTRLAETPFWMGFTVTSAAEGKPVAIEFPSRHAMAMSCWNADGIRLLGSANRVGADGALSAAKAGFKLMLPAGSAPQIVCKASFIGPARFSIAQWEEAGLEASALEFQHNSGLLDGGLLVLAAFMLVTALINRQSLYVLFAAWLIANLRVGALSAGWDFQWLGRTIPVDWIQPIRLVTIAAYYMLTLTLFQSLFRDNLVRVGYGAMVRTAQWTCAALLLLALVLPFASFLPIIWTATGLGIAMLVFLLARILYLTRSAVAIWYSAAIVITLFASMYEVLSAALGFKGLIGTVNSVTAALSSSLLASLAIAEQMRFEHQQRLEAQAELQHNYEAMPIGLFTLDMEGRFISANPALLDMLGNNVTAAQHNAWQQHFEDGAWSELHKQVHTRFGAELEIRGRKPVPATDGAAPEQKRFQVKATLARGKIEGWLQDVTERSKVTEDLNFLANNDPLTKVLNRRGIEKAYADGLRLLDQGKPLAMAYLDLDRFKLINDLYGHPIGDEVLRQVCERMRRMLAAAQHIGRVGGDEFVIVMPDTTMQLATWICRGIVGGICNEPFRIGDKAFQVGVSIGLIEVSPATLIGDALSSADRACREAKTGHGDGLTVYEKNAAAFQERKAELQLVERLSGDSAPEGLFLEMQPIMSLKAPDESLNFEVLLRMRNEDGSVIPAGRIIGAAESSGRTGVVDRWVLATTLDWIDTHHAHLGRTQFVCMNLSGASLNDERFVHDAYAMLERNPRAARRLCIEITESVALHDLDNTRRFIDMVRGHGVKVALDDFGAGYTSFSYLKELPADVLKIDGSFIVNMNAHPTNVAIVEAIVNLAMNLGMKTIAEWAEDNATVKTLAEIGVDYVQGYAIARAQPPAKMLMAASSASFIQDEALASFVKALGENDGSLPLVDMPDRLSFKNLH
jgi:diguanylate cyclase (GGDEF)-like protein